MDVALAIEQQVPWLAVAVDDTLGMRGVEGAAGLLEPNEDLQRLLRTSFAQHVVERAAAQVLHDDVRPLVVLADIEDGHGVGLARQARRGKGLARESLADSLVQRVAVGQDLDRNGTAEHGVGRPVDVAHAAAADLLRTAIAGRKDVDLYSHSRCSNEFARDMVAQTAR